MATKKRLIDANTLLKVLKHRVKGNEDSGIVLGTNSALGIMEEWVRSIPTVDAVEVVRCKDCYNCTKSNWCNLLMMDVKNEGFCSYGKRRSDA